MDNNSLIKEFELPDGRTLEIHYDTFCDSANPRDWDNAGTMVCGHRNYRLGDPDVSIQDAFDIAVHAAPDDVVIDIARQLDAEGFADYCENYAYEGQSEADNACDFLNSLDKGEMWEVFAQFDGHGITMLPLYLYDHSGITMNTRGFHCQWDSGQVGWIYITDEQANTEWSGEYKKTTEQIREYLREEVKIYDMYLTGSVYGFVLNDPDGEHEDSCWGFLGDNDLEKCGMACCLGEEIISAIQEKYGSLEFWS